MSPTTALQQAEEFRRALMKLEWSRVQRYISAYTPIYQDLSMQISALTAELALMDDPKVWKVNKLQRLTDLKKQVAAELNDFGTYVDRDIRADVKKFVKMGLDHSEALVYAGMPKELAGAIANQWNRLPVEAVQTAMGFFEPRSPLHAKLKDNLGTHIADLIGDKVTKGIATGMNPQTIGRILNTQLGIGLNSAMNTARTSMLYAYREAGRANYLANSDIVDQWIWGAHLNDERTCMACVMMHGSKHPLSEPLNDHFMGRCTMIPLTKSWEDLGLEGVPDTRPQIESGEDWFKKLSEDEQRRRMGAKAFEAWKSNKITLGDLVTTHPNDVYGPMIGVRSLSGKAPGGSGTKPVEPAAPPAAPAANANYIKGYDPTVDSPTLTWVESRIEKLADSFDMSYDEAKRAVEENLQKLLDGKGVSIRASTGGAQSILSDGRFKSQFETRYSNGALNFNGRMNAEHRGLGVPFAIDNSQRPIYGYINHPLSDPSQYGDIEFILGQSVHDRTTWTIGDSLANFANENVKGGKFGKWDDMKAWDTSFAAMLDGDADTFFGYVDYVEAQIHGGVTLEDVVGVVIHRDRGKSSFYYDNLIRQLEKQGIPWQEAT